MWSAGTPGRHHETIQMFLGNDIPTGRDQFSDDIICTDAQFPAFGTHPVGPAGHLVESGLFHFPESDQAVVVRGFIRVWIEAAVPFIIIPILLDYAFRAALIIFGMMPGVVAPGPRPGIVPFHFADDEEEVMPPGLSDSQYLIRKAALVLNCFFIIANVEETGVSENLHDI